ncbi:MAG: rod shape-determining protein MreC [Thermodesulfovibrionales bacterium]|nr:rod shape-determining protein MreC [Thermodesulfovibrionales bacterium]
MKFKPVFLLIILIIVISFTTSKVFGPLKFLSYPYDFLSLLTSEITDTVSSEWRAFTLKKKRLREIEQDVALLTERLAEYENIKRENIILKELLGLKDSEKKIIAFARVIRRGIARWTSAVVIDKGEADGLKKDMAVITPKGLTGKILVANRDFSEVLLLDDVNFRVAVRFLGSRTEGIATGTGQGVIVKYVPKDAEIIKGDWVITSGLDGLFPEGILVGYVADIRDREFFKEVSLKTSQDLRGLEFVAVISR